MNYERLRSFNTEILSCPFVQRDQPPCRRAEGFSPVINELWPTQKYLLISSDPSRDTDKSKSPLEAHSNFERRFLALVFTGSDEVSICRSLENNHSSLKEIFLTYFYWAHFCKCFSNGNPNSYCAKRYLQKEIELFQPRLIIAIGGKAANFLLGPGRLIEKVNRIWQYQQDIPVICTLHPSQNWNRQKREEYFFYETWKLIRQEAKLDLEDELKIRRILKQVRKGITR